MDPLRLIREMARSRAVGPSPSFTEFDVVKTLELIHEDIMGRTKLSKELGLGQGATRTILSHLQQAGLVNVQPSGCILTTKGSSFVRSLKSIVRFGFDIPHVIFPIGKYNAGALVSRAGKKLKKGLEQRDAAIRVGASGAITLVYRNGKVLFPPKEVASREWPGVSKEIIEIFQPSEEDVIIVTGGETPRSAEAGARAAAWTLIETN